MASFTDVAALIPTLCGHLADDACAAEAQKVMAQQSDAAIVAILEEAAEVSRAAEQIRLVAVGFIAARSGRGAGHSGLAQSRGFRSPEALIQALTGVSRGDAAQSVRVGRSLVEDGSEEESFGSDLGVEPEGEAGADSGPAEAESESDSEAESDAGADSGLGSEPAPQPPRPSRWDDVLRVALRDGVLSAAQYDAICRGLGEPPIAEGSVRADADTLEAWAQAAEQLVGEAQQRSVEELGASARMIRDLLDPEGAERRFLARHEKRSFRMYRDHEGVRRASIAFDDEGGLFLEALIDAAMRPRRGGPRFVDADEKARAAELVDDPRTNDQLTYDLIIDVLRAGAFADVHSVFGARQAGVRLVHTVDAGGNRAPMAHTEDGLSVVPAGVADQRVCESGYTSVTVDSCGNPLDAGREYRLFTPKQRIALALRDGGCRWRGCDRPASYCEAHHIDPYSEGGRTDIDRGILLCRFHHMNLHHGRWRIVRDGRGEFVLRHPSGEQFVLVRRVALAYAWGGIDPPPKRFRPAA